MLARDRGICHVCHKPGADQCDHVVAGDDHRYSNLAAIHAHPCHAAKSSSEGGRASQQAHPRARRNRPPEAHPGLVA